MFTAEAMPTVGYIYVLVNPSIPGMVKIGKTKRHPESRAREMSQSTGLPTAHSVAFKVRVSDIDLAERIAHRSLASSRVTRDREWFRASLERAKCVVSEVARELPLIEQAQSWTTTQKSVTPRQKAEFESLEAYLWSLKPRVWTRLGGKEDHKNVIGSFTVRKVPPKRSLEVEALVGKADGGCAFTQYLLGWMYEQGIDVLKNTVEALAWYRKAAASGEDRAFSRLVHILTEGPIELRSSCEAAKWSALAAKQTKAKVMERGNQRS
jgi:hypothetical protein